MGPVHRIAFVEFKGKPVLLAASAYGTMLLDPDSRAACTDHTYGGIPAVYTVVADGTPVIISSDADDILRIWDVETGRPLGAPLVGHRLLASALAVGELPNGSQTLASGSFDATVRLWRLDSGQEFAELHEHADQYPEDYMMLYMNRAINDLAFGKFGGVSGLVSASGDQTLRVWNLENLEEFGPPLTGHTYGVNSMACGRLRGIDVIVSGGDDHMIGSGDR